MSKRTVRLTESDLHNIIKESINNIISELDWRTYQSASDKASDKANATNNKYEKQRRKNQANSFANAGAKRFSSQYNLPSGFENDVEFGNIVPTQGQLKNAARRNDDAIKFYNGKSEYRDGKWQDK